MVDDEINIFKDKNIWLTVMKRILNTTKIMYTIPSVKDLYKRKDEFDIVVMDALFNKVRWSRVAMYENIHFPICIYVFS